MVLLRHLLGDVLRRLRLRQGRTLREVSAAARVSLGYLSEVERGQKEASSELLAAICTALGTPLSQVFREVSDNFALAELQHEPVLTGSREPSLELPEGERLGSPVPALGSPVPALGSPVPALGSPGTDSRPRAQPLAFGEAPRIRGADDAASRLPDVTDMIPA
jgi:transcriptional regulator with XRE-family HTH domain